jgi:heme O synthase-like polyprenyltransferase
VLPVKRGMARTKIHMLLYILCFVPVALLLTFWNYTGMLYFGVTLTLSLMWLGLCVKGYNGPKNSDHRLSLYPSYEMEEDNDPHSEKVFA